MSDNSWSISLTSHGSSSSFSWQTHHSINVILIGYIFTLIILLIIQRHPWKKKDSCHCIDAKGWHPKRMWEKIHIHGEFAMQEKPLRTEQSAFFRGGGSFTFSSILLKHSLRWPIEPTLGLVIVQSGSAWSLISSEYKDDECMLLLDPWVMLLLDPWVMLLLDSWVMLDHQSMVCSSLWPPPRGLVHWLMVSWSSHSSD